MTRRRVVITGMGTASSAGVGPEALWNVLAHGLGTAQVVPQLAAAGSKVTWACPAKDFDPRKLIAQRKALKLMCRDIMLAVVASGQAYADAGLEGGQVDPERIGVVLGAGLIPSELAEFAPAVSRAGQGRQHIDMGIFGADGIKEFFPLWMLKYLPNMLACQVTIAQQIRGVSNTITTGAASAHQSVAESVRIIERGGADIMLAGAGESKVHPLIMARLALLGHLAPEEGNPEDATRPFDQYRHGYVASEAAGIVVCEELEHARRRGARIYAELAGLGDACSQGNPSTFEGAAAAVAGADRKALANANLAPSQIGLVSACGYALPDADRYEAAAIRQVFASPGHAAPQVPVTAMKSMLGNAGCGGGATEIIGSVLALTHATLPPTRNVTQVDPECGLNIVTQAQAAPQLNAVITHAFTLGGQAAALVLKRV